MLIVTFTRDMRPWQAGADAVLPDAVAERLVAEGSAKDARPFPPPDVVPSVAPDRPLAAQTLSIGQKRYMTRAERRAARGA